MTLLYSVNLRLNGKSNVGLFNYESIFDNMEVIIVLVIQKPEEQVVVAPTTPTPQISPTTEPAQPSPTSEITPTTQPTEPSKPTITPRSICNLGDKNPSNSYSDNFSIIILELSNII